MGDLAKLAQVNEASAHTVRWRHASLLEEVGTVPTGRRGGQPKKYRLTAAAEREITDLIRDLYSRMPGPVPAPFGHGDAPDLAFRSALAAAEHALADRVPDAKDETALTGDLRMARAALRAAELALERMPEHGRRQEDRDLFHHRERLEALTEQLERRVVDPSDAPAVLDGRIADLLTRADDEVLDDRVLLLRCLPADQPDDAGERLERLVRDLLSRSGAEVIDFDLSQEKDGIRAQLEAGDIASIVLVDSSDGRSRRHCRELLKRAREHAFVLDLASSAALENDVLMHDSWYVSHAAKLHRDALGNAFKKMRVPARRRWADVAPAAESLSEVARA